MPMLLAGNGSITGASSFTDPATFQSTLSVTGALTQSSGAAFSLASGQLAFPATQNASSNANTLDDYEEGTWVPTTTGISGTGIAYTANYVKIGRLVFCSVTVTGTGMTATSPTITQPFSGNAYGTGSWISGGGASAGSVQSVPFGNSAQLSGSMTSTTIMNIAWCMFTAT